jgi:hypothetical protein
MILCYLLAAGDLRIEMRGLVAAGYMLCRLRRFLCGVRNPNIDVDSWKSGDLIVVEV